MHTCTSLGRAVGPNKKKEKAKQKRAERSRRTEKRKLKICATHSGVAERELVVDVDFPRRAQLRDLGELLALEAALHPLEQAQPRVSLSVVLAWDGRGGGGQRC